MTDGWLFWIQNWNRNWIRMLLIFLSLQIFLIIEKKVIIYGRKKQQERVINT